MSFLKNADSKLVIVGLGTLAVVGSFLVWAILFGVFAAGFGMNEDLAFGLSFLMWLVTVAVMIFGVISFYNNSIKNRMEQVTVTNTLERVTMIREVIGPPPSELQVAVEEPLPILYDPGRYTNRHVSHQPMLVEGDETDEPEPEPISEEPEHPAPPSVSYRSILLEEDKGEDSLR